MGLSPRGDGRQRRPAPLPGCRHRAGSRRVGPAPGAPPPPRRPGLRPAVPRGRADLRAPLVVLQRDLVDGQRRLRPSPSAAAHGLRAVPADVPRRLRPCRRACCGARGDPRRRGPGVRLSPRRPAREVRRGCVVAPHAEPPPGAAAAGRRVDQELRVRRLRRCPRPDSRSGAVALRPPRRRRRRRAGGRGGAHRARGRTHSRTPSSVGDRLARDGPAASLDPARIGSFSWWTWALFPVPLLVFDLVFARSAALTAVRRSVRWRGRTVDLDRRTATEEVA